MKGKILMNNKADLSNEKGFYIWFDKNNKKEYYTTTLTLYNSKIGTSKNSKYSYIYYTDSFLPKVYPKRNRAEYIKNALKPKPLDLYNPYEERYGMFLLEILMQHRKIKKVLINIFQVLKM